MQAFHLHSNSKRLTAHRHVVEHQTQRAPIPGVLQAPSGDDAAVVISVDHLQVPPDGAVGHRARTQVGEHPGTVGLAVGSTIREITRSLNTASSTVSKPSLS